jgi:hypothetical protein
MLAWLNANAGAVQAFGSIVVAVATVVLVIITARYVALTRTLADAAAAQITAQAAAAKARRGELQAAVHFLQFALKSLPNSSERGAANEMIRTSIPTDDFDFGRFRELSTEIGAGAAAVVVESNMKSFNARITQIREIDEVQRGPGYWQEFDWRTWNNALIDVREALDVIEAEAK